MAVTKIGCVQKWKKKKNSGKTTTYSILQGSCAAGCLQHGQKCFLATEGLASPGQLPVMGLKSTFNFFHSPLHMFKYLKREGCKEESI